MHCHSVSRRRDMLKPRKKLHVNAQQHCIPHECRRGRAHTPSYWWKAVEVFISHFAFDSWFPANRLTDLDREIAGISLPALASLAADPIAGLVDTAYIGRLGTFCWTVSSLFRNTCPDLHADELTSLDWPEYTSISCSSEIWGPRIGKVDHWWSVHPGKTWTRGQQLTILSSKQVGSKIRIGRQSCNSLVAFKLLDSAAKEGMKFACCTSLCMTPRLQLHCEQLRLSHRFCQKIW